MEKVFLMLMFNSCAYLVSLCNIDVISFIFWMMFAGVMIYYSYLLFIELYPFLEKGFLKIDGVLNEKNI